MLLSSARQFTRQRALKEKQNCGDGKFCMLYLSGPLRPPSGDIEEVRNSEGSSHLVIERQVSVELG